VVWCSHPGDCERSPRACGSVIPGRSARHTRARARHGSASAPQTTHSSHQPAAPPHALQQRAGRQRTRCSPGSCCVLARRPCGTRQRARTPTPAHAAAAVRACDQARARVPPSRRSGRHAVRRAGATACAAGAARPFRRGVGTGRRAKRSLRRRRRRSARALAPRGARVSRRPRRTRASSAPPRLARRARRLFGMSLGERQGNPPLPTGPTKQADEAQHRRRRRPHTLPCAHAPRAREQPHRVLPGAHGMQRAAHARGARRARREHASTGV
jgi:hypothetical protein